MIEGQHFAILMNKFTPGKEKKDKASLREEEKKIREVQCGLQAVKRDWAITLISLSLFIRSGVVWLQVESLFNYNCKGQEIAG